LRKQIVLVALVKKSLAAIPLRRVEASTSSESTRTAPISRAAELNLRVLWSLARHVSDRYGAAALEKIARSAALSPSELDGKSRWISHEQFELFLKNARAQMVDDDELRAASAYRLREGYGPLRYLLSALSPSLMYAQATRTMPLVSTISRYEIISSAPNAMHARYLSQKPESRLMCLSRMAQVSAIPTLWGLPPAELRESSCIANGDPFCDYHLRWFESRRWLPAFAGLVVGGALSSFAFQLQNVEAIVATTLLAGACGLIYELYRTSRTNIALSSEINDALTQVAREDAEARREILAFHDREREWSRVMEEQVSDRTDSLRRVVERIQQLREARETTLRGVSHDLRNPLSVLKLASYWLGKHDYLLGKDGRVIVDDQQRAIGQMERLLTELMHFAASEEALIELTTEYIEVSSVSDKLNRRLRALALGRNIRVSVMQTREAPARIETDIHLFDRVLDNLLTNAVKYTDRGSILVEVGGTPGFLTIKISDTGRGIDNEQINRIFQAGGSEETARAPNSWGVGLSVVVRLLAQIGGRLEVMSVPGQGTTFWAHFPEVVQAARRQPPGEGEDRALVAKVVTIRRA
jgi:signal transduction histidine kinase